MLYLQSEIQINLIMSEKELNSYRFSSSEEPTDEMLSQIMSEVTADAIERRKESDAKYRAMMEKQREILKFRWSQRIKNYING